ncbi:26S proteasome non-ATPase regulatory subunit 8-like [Sycon ciliatum]|uniref:26S proteasome non-ATPase regulatory subunit 8-like n=1 Tax=Sycon ciliatum TaxID=27933 RepID=UPI0020AE460C|eukprot:scpid86344/ scgid9905/ 26S proteasome non-ATPase regulatory subunit 8; 26S proteasome regulatory subunit RPN12
MALDDETLRLREQLFAEWNKDEKSRELGKVGELLSLLKRKLITLTFLPNVGSQPSAKELVIARDVLEVGAQWSIEKGDLASFERYLSQLKCYYFNFKSQLEDSPYMNELLGLNLLSLLVQSRLAEFHTEIELLPREQLNTSMYFKYPIQLEQSLMEGCYNKVFTLREMSPARSYLFLLNIMTDTVRAEIASCIEKAYRSIDVDDAMSMLSFTSEPDALEFARGRSWQSNESKQFVFCEPEPEGRYVSSDGLIGNTLTYARELERIV